MRRFFVALVVLAVPLSALALYVFHTKPTWYERARYPLHYSAIVREQARAKDLDPALVAAVIYQESRFQSDARSRTGAVGLMQLQPETAQAIALRTGGTAFQVSDLTNPAINIRYGSWYLQNLFEKYRNERLVLAAYNAGQGNVDRWLAAGQQIEYAETRAYVEAVASVKRIYREAWRDELYPDRVMLDPVLELAENPNTYTPLAPTDERIVTDRYVLWMGRADHPAWNVAQRFRFRPDELDEVRAEIHAALRARGRTGCSWEVGSSAAPADLVDRLLALGLEYDDDSFAVGMVLTEPPAQAPPADVEVRRVQTEEDALVAAQIAAVAFGMAEPVPAPVDPEGRWLRYLAYVDGEPVAQASAAFSEHGVTLFGGATLPAARGRGAYRALVAARWDDAVARGTPVLVTQAGAQSRPILARLGFREVCEIRALIDVFGR